MISYLGGETPLDDIKMWKRLGETFALSCKKMFHNILNPYKLLISLRRTSELSEILRDWKERDLMRCPIYLRRNRQYRLIVCSQLKRLLTKSRLSELLNYKSMPKRTLSLPNLRSASSSSRFTFFTRPQINSGIY